MVAYIHRVANATSYKATYIKTGHSVEAWEILYVTTLYVEAGSVPRTSHTALAKVTLAEWSSIMRAFVSDSRELTILFDKECLGIS